jgi:K+-transporting ATPase KdpF subunit
LRQAGFTSASAKNFRNNMESTIVGIIALLLFGYLFVAMIRPEKF